MYYVAVQRIDISKTSTYQGLCINTEREWILYNWYWSIEYTCVMDRIDEEFILSKYSITVFKSGEAGIDYKLSHMFKRVYERFYAIFRNTQQVRKVGVRIIGKCDYYVFWNLSHTSNMLPYASIKIIGLMLLSYIYMILLQWFLLPT